MVAVSGYSFMGYSPLGPPKEEMVSLDDFFSSVDVRPSTGIFLLINPSTSVRADSDRRQCRRSSSHSLDFPLFVVLQPTA